MTAQVIDGKAFAARLRETVADYARAFEKEVGRKAALAVVLVGEDPASHVYVASKTKAVLEAGMGSLEFKLPADAPEDKLLDRVRALNADPDVDGILVQLPVPEHMNENRVIATIHPSKDVDGFNIINVGRLVAGLHGFVPCTPLGCLMLLKDRLGSVEGLEAVVVGRSNIVGKPMAALLTRENATVTLAHSRTRNLPEVVRRADIVVAAVGKARFVKGSWLKPALDDAKVPDTLQRDCIRYLIDRITLELQELVKIDSTRIALVDSTNTLSEGDWANELHPKPSGFKKIATQKWRPVLQQRGLA